jgi:hypothetical protein
VLFTYPYWGDGVEDSKIAVGVGKEKGLGRPVWMG